MIGNRLTPEDITLEIIHQHAEVFKRQDLFRLSIAININHRSPVIVPQKIGLLRGRHVRCRDRPAHSPIGVDAIQADQQFVPSIAIDIIPLGFMAGPGEIIPTPYLLQIAII